MFECLREINNDPFINLFSLENNTVVNKIAYLTGLSKLPPHAHEILFSCAFYFLIQLTSILLAPVFSPAYKKLDKSKKHGFDAHIVSNVNAFVMCGMSFPLFFSKELNTLTSYTPYAGLTIAVTIGYFLWDFFVTLYYYKYNGFGFLVHAVVALYVFSASMRPFLMAYAAPFMWFEASTPFVNINWFGTHIPNLISDTVRMYNALLLFLVFFLCRVVSGPINGYILFSELFRNLPQEVPILVTLSIVLAYAAMIGLNFLWFSKMMRILGKMAKGGSGKSNNRNEPAREPILPIEERRRRKHVS